MTFSSREARVELLAEITGAVAEMADALAALGVAYELLDEATADRLETGVFRPLQLAYGRAKRTHDGFSARHGLPAGSFATAGGRAPSAGVEGLLADAVESVEEADTLLSELQDSMAPVEVGDPELRAGLGEVRELLAGALAGARAFGRDRGR